MNSIALFIRSVKKRTNQINAMRTFGVKGLKDATAKKSRWIHFLRAILPQSSPKSLFNDLRFAFLLAGLNLLIQPAALQAQFTYITNADGVTLTITGYGGPPWAVTIPTNINGLTVTGIGEYAFDYCHDLTGVIIPGSVTSIGSDAFANCTSLTSVMIVNGATNIGSDAFFLCKNLNSVFIPSSITSVGQNAFDQCTRLTAITVDTNNALYSSLNGVLFDKSQTTLVEFPGGLGGGYTIPNSVTNIVEWAFADCFKLTCLYFLGNAPSADSTVFNQDTNATAYYLPGTTGWGSLFAGIPATLEASQFIDSGGYTFTTFVGKAGSGSDDGVGSDAQFNSPQGIAVDKMGDVYVVDSGNNTVREISPAGVVTTIAGLAGFAGSADGQGSAARFNFTASEYVPDFDGYYSTMPVFSGIALDQTGNLYVADSGNHEIRMITPKGTNWMVSTIAGSMAQPAVNYLDGIGTNAHLLYPSGIAVGTDGSIYFEDTQEVCLWTNFDEIRKIIPIITAAGTNWMVSTLATNINCQTNAPYLTWTYQGVAVDNLGNVYVAQCNGGGIGKITQTGSKSYLNFSAEYGVAVDGAGNLYAAEGSGNTIQTLTTNGVMTTNSATGSDAPFLDPQGVAVDASGKLYVTDTGNNLIRTISSAGVVSILAGTGPTSMGSADGSGSTARFNQPTGLALDASGTLYVADSSNNTIRIVTSAGLVNTLAGMAGNAGNANGPGSQARFNNPQGIAVDANYNVYVADTGNGIIRMITPAGMVSTIAGSGGAYLEYPVDGIGTNAMFCYPSALAVDSAGNIYVSDQGGSYFSFEGTAATRKISLTNGNWVVATIHVNTGNAVGCSQQCSGIALDSAGNFYSLIRAFDQCYEPTFVSFNIAESTPTVVVHPGVRVQGMRESTDSLLDYRYTHRTSGLAVDSAGNAYVSDCLGSTIRKFMPLGTNWVMRTIGGTSWIAGSVDAAGTNALFNAPAGVVVDSAGNIYVADAGNNTIRKGTFTPSTVAKPGLVAQPLNNAILVVTLLPPEANGEWRFPWELAWRSSGTAATNLAPNQNYPVEFSTIPGYLVIPSLVTNYVAAGETNYVTNQYYPTVTSVDTNIGGSLEVLFQVNPPSGAGWRLLGDTRAFLPSGFTTNLLPGNYLIECAALTNFVQIPILSVQISAGVPTVVQEVYQPSQAAPTGLLLPVPVPTGEISDLTDYPYGFNGQLETDVGYGSGVAVQPNVVLTAAHLIFNDQTLSYVSEAWWYPQEDAPQFVPQPQQAQGWLVLSGYASARTNDLQSGF